MVIEQELHIERRKIYKLLNNLQDLKIVDKYRISKGKLFYGLNHYKRAMGYNKIFLESVSVKLLWTILQSKPAIKELADILYISSSTVRRLIIGWNNRFKLIKIDIYIQIQKTGRSYW